MVEVDGKWREMTFLSDNLEWSAQTIVDLYRCRWEIEVFFKEIKQTLQLADFLGHNANAVRWQVWTALLTYVLLRFCAWISKWGHSFTRLFTLARSALWLKLDLRSFLESYGTAEVVSGFWERQTKPICQESHKAMGQPKAIIATNTF
jgi:IS4 transposase